MFRPSHLIVLTIIGFGINSTQGFVFGGGIIGGVLHGAADVVKGTGAIAGGVVNAGAHVAGDVVKGSAAIAGGVVGAGVGVASGVVKGVGAILGLEPTCKTSSKMDLQILVDSSLSVQQKNFETMMNGIAGDIIGQLDIGQDKTRVALLKFSHKMNKVFDLGNLKSKSDLVKITANTKFLPGSTMTAKAMNQAFNSFVHQQRHDKNLRKVCLVFTDGEAVDKDQVPAASKRWNDDGVMVFAIGIGPEISKEGLIQISGSSERALAIKSFAELGEKMKGLLKNVCTKIDISWPKFGLGLVHGAGSLVGAGIGAAGSIAGAGVGAGVGALNGAAKLAGAGIGAAGSIAGAGLSVGADALHGAGKLAGAGVGAAGSIAGAGLHVGTGALNGAAKLAGAGVGAAGSIAGAGLHVGAGALHGAGNAAGGGIGVAGSIAGAGLDAGVGALHGAGKLAGASVGANVGVGAHVGAGVGVGFHMGGGAHIGAGGKAGGRGKGKGGFLFSLKIGK